ncbi:MAG TPA: BPSS1780 family membrane protein, partial [Casimicrobiaceae bacterium]|nr:BPSS1780 family membrane protein [Casimicrobiaceae bacterium]
GSIAQTLLLPVFSAGVMLGCQALARGEPLRLGHLFEGFQGGRFGSLVVLGLLMMAAGIVFAIIMFIVIAATVGPAAFSAMMSNGDPTRLGVSFGALGIGIFLIIAIGLIGGVLIGMAYWFAPALVVLNGESPFNAIKKSFSATWLNFGAFLIYGLIYIGLAILATIPFGLGWLVLGPMIGGSCYAGWREIFGE